MSTALAQPLFEARRPIERRGETLAQLLTAAFVSERCDCPVCGGRMEHAKCNDCGSRVT